MTPAVSIVLVAFDMGEQIARTVRSLSPTMQRGVQPADCEIVVVDNGSSEGIDREAAEAGGGDVRWIRVEDATPSPAPAINLGIRDARAPLVGAMIDGARLASPGLIRAAILAARLDPRAIAVTHGYHLGREPQQLAVASGYDERAEARLLAGAGWEEDGYRLFDVSVLSPSSRNGVFALPYESNALFMRAEMWQELGGYDEAFTSPGGGLVNLDVLARACALPGARPVILLGEGTFHQVHGGYTTNSPVSRWDAQQDEYVKLRGAPFRPPEAKPWIFGLRVPGD